MSEQAPGGNPLAEGLGETAEKAVELAAVIAIGARAAARVHEQRRRAHAAEGAEAEAERQRLRAEHSAARSSWGDSGGQRQGREELRQLGGLAQAPLGLERMGAQAQGPAELGAGGALDGRGVERDHARLAEGLGGDPGVSRGSVLGGAASLDAQGRAAGRGGPDGGAVEAARTWLAAEPWAAYDEAARRAMQGAEQELTRLHPEFMADYAHRKAAGAEPLEAFVEAAKSGEGRGSEDLAASNDFNRASVFVEEVGARGVREDLGGREALEDLSGRVEGAGGGVDLAEDLGGRGVVEDLGGRGAAVAAGVLANEELEVAASNADLPDLASTSGVNEHIEGMKVSGEYLELAGADSRRASALASTAYPHSIQATLAASRSLPRGRGSTESLTAAQQRGRVR